MPQFPVLKTGQQAVTASAAALPAFPGAGLGAGEGYRVLIEALKANSISVFYGSSGVTTSTGKELAPGAQDEIYVSNLNQIYVIASTTGASVSWVITNIP